MAETVSNKPWSDFSQSDYTDEQWLHACLLDRGADAGSAKQRASLPVREPDGTLNKNACHAAAAALAGARGGVKASPELLAKAKKKLLALYASALDSEAPESLKHHIERAEAFLEHFGVKGMRWGVRKDDVLGVSPLGSRGAVVVTRPAKEGGPRAKLGDQYQAADATHNIAKKLATDVDNNKTWVKIEKEMTANKVSPDDIVKGGEIVARHLTAAAQKYTLPGTTARVMVSHTNNTTMNPSQRPMMHLIVAKNKEDVDGYVTAVRNNLNAGKPGMDPKKNWIVHDDLNSGVDVLELFPILDEFGFVVGIQDPDLVQHGEDMDHSVSTFLSTQGVSLSHIAVRDETTTSDGKKGGHGNFDETKVKRDGRGQFAKKAAAKDAEADELWKQHLLNLKLEIAIEAKSAIKKAGKEILEKHGFSIKEVRNSSDNFWNKHPEVKKELIQSYAKCLDDVAKQVAVSPSGTQRLQYAVSKKGESYSRIVPYSGPMPERSKPQPVTRVNVKKETRKAVRSSPGSTTSVSGGMHFNPNATLDTSRVSDASDPVVSDDDDDESLLSKIGSLFHSDLPESEKEVSLTHATVNGQDDALAGPTVDDVVAAMNEDQRETLDIVVGAALADFDISGYPEVVQRYNDLSAEHKNIIDFIVGGLLAEGTALAHSDIDDEDVIAHYGIKGMRWGFRKSNDNSTIRLSSSAENTPEGRKVARDAVKSGSATLGQAHLAGLKSTGHRVANAFLGDKTYWKRAAVIAGFTAVGVGATVASAGLLPTGILTSIGAHALGGTVITAAGKTAVVTSVGGHTAVVGGAALVQLGQQAVVGIGLGVTHAAATTAGLANAVTNTARAIRGNARIDKSYAALGKTIQARQTAGTKRVNKILRRDGSLRKKDLTHSFQENVETILQHAARAEFDESKVHRDSDGMFAKQVGKSARIADMEGVHNSVKSPLNAEKADEAKTEKDWMTNKHLSSVKDKVTVAAMPAIMEAQTRVLKKYKLSSMSDLTSNDKARTELATAVRDAFQSQADKLDTSSPSGDHKIVYKIGAKGNVYAQVVDKKGAPAKDFSDMKPIEHTRVRELAQKIRESGWRPPMTRSTGSSSTSAGTTKPSTPSGTRPTTKPTTQTPDNRPNTSETASVPKTKKPNPFRNEKALALREERSDSELEDDISKSVSDLFDLFDSKEIKHSDTLITNFLAHHGIKGMRWGIRRSNKVLDANAAEKATAKLNSAQAKLDKKQAKLDSKAAKKGLARGSSEDDKKDEDPPDHIAVDAERFVKSRMKQGYEMSDRELKETLQRAKLVKEYNDMFSGGPNAELKAKVEALKLQKEAAEYKAALTPDRLARVQKFMKTAESGFEAYSKLNKATGSQLNPLIAKQFGVFKTAAFGSGAKNAAASAAASAATGGKSKVRVSDFLRDVKMQNQGGRHKVGVPTTRTSASKKSSPVFKITDLGDAAPKPSDFGNGYSYSKALDLWEGQRKNG